MQTVNVNPEILRWARETAGLEREEAAQKLQIRDDRGVNAAARLAALERGDIEPTRPMLLRMAKQYHHPLVTFYMSKPPRVGRRTAGFRRLTANMPPRKAALLNALIRDCLARQGIVHAVLEEDDEADSLPFVGCVSRDDGKAAALNALKSLLKVSADMFTAQTDDAAAFDLLRADVESNGVFVLLEGDLGSCHTAIGADVFRGFTISDDLAPFIAINHRHAQPAWSLTLLRELTRLLLGQSGMTTDYHNKQDRVVESFCNEVAREFLTTHATPNDQWDRDMQCRQKRQRADEPNCYAARRRRAGRALIDFTREMMGTGDLSTTKAAIALGVKPTQVGQMLDRHEAS